MTRPRSFAVLMLLALVVPVVVPAALATEHDTSARSLPLRDSVVVNAAAVAQTSDGLIGSIAKVTITVADEGAGHIFIDTVPLTQVDMQGSARLAVKVAGQVTGLDLAGLDVFFTVRSPSQVIGGPSAGGIMTVGVIAALKGWAVNHSVMMTGTVNPDGSVGPVGGVPEKAGAAADVGATLFLFPDGQERAVFQGRTVDMGDYCRTELGIRCLPVADVEDAVRFVTGHAFDRPAVDPDALASERFQALLRPLSADLLANAATAEARAAANLSAATDLASTVRQNLQESLARANASVVAATAAFDAGSYYTTASRAFQASIEARYVDLAVEFFAASDASAFTARVQADAQRFVDRAAAAARAASPADATELQAVGAAQVRASEAERLLARAQSLRENATTLATFLEGLHDTAFTIERALTVEWWLRIGAQFAADGSAPPIDATRLRETALESIETAQETVTYAELLLQESGVGLTGSRNARTLLEDARRDYNAGYPAAALYEALEADVRAGLAVELLGYSGGVPESKVTRARTQAAEAIVAARDRGFEPILAESYFEFAAAVLDVPDQLAFYKLARTIARSAASVGGITSEPRDSRFVGDGAPVTRGASALPVNSTAFLALGLALALGFMIAVVVLPRRQAPPPPAMPWQPGGEREPENPWTWASEPPTPRPGAEPGAPSVAPFANDPGVAAPTRTPVPPPGPPAETGGGVVVTSTPGVVPVRVPAPRPPPAPAAPAPPAADDGEPEPSAAPRAPVAFDVVAAKPARRPLADDDVDDDEAR